MIKLNSTARVLFGMACLAVAGLSAAGCGASGNASPTGSGPGAIGTLNAQTSAVPAVTLPANSPSATTASPNPAPADTLPAKAAPTTAPAAPRGAATTPPAPGSGTTRCHTSDLSASYGAVVDSEAAGSISYNLRLTNTSTHQCTIYGYAGMLLLDANHRPLPTNVQRDALVPKRLLRLDPGGSAAATARFSPDVPGVGDNPGQSCQPTAHYTEVTPPDETTQLVTAVSPPTSVCERGTIALSAFIAGRTGPNQ